MPPCINYFKTVLYNCGGKTFHLNLNKVSGIFFLPPIYGIKVLLGCLLSNQSNFICIRIHVLNELLYNFKLCFYVFAFVSPVQSGYIDGPILQTFRTNLVVLPLVMEYMQYGFIALGLATILIAAFVYHRERVRRRKRSRACLFS